MLLIDEAGGARQVRDEKIREQQLLDLAAQARQTRAALAAAPARDGESVEDAEDRRQRMKVLKERERQIERDHRLELGKRNMRRKEEDRDISERIALGQVAQPRSSEVMFDQRLFNQSAGMDSCLSSAVYDTPLFADRRLANVYGGPRVTTRSAPLEFETDDEEL
ncbi:unnamed protein product [Durusdinium trenchii]|uniref:Uncharacterized protein n=1 Tax=Durusdinium trenchii TaxID=1381693 RepID=A0ABP0ND35_9DINO